MSRYRSKWLEIHTLYQMGIAFFLNPENVWHDESPQVLSFWQQGKIPRNARNIGVKHEGDPCTYVGRVLKKFALRTQELKQKTRPDGTRYREYSIREIDPLSQVVYECLEQRIKNQVSEFNFDWEKIVKNSSFKTAETLTNQGLQTAHLQPDNYIEARVEVCGVAGGYQQPKGENGVAEKPDPVTELSEAFPYCDTPKDFALVLEGFDATFEQIEEAIAVQPTMPQRQQLRQWFSEVVGEIQSITVDHHEVATDGVSSPAVRSWEWTELPLVNSVLKWIDRSGEQVRLLSLDLSGGCQVRSLLSGLVTHTRIDQLMPVSG